MDVLKAMMVGASGMKAQSARMRIIAQNMANSGSTGAAPGEEPYRRQVPIIASAFDRELDVHMVEMAEPQRDQSGFGKKYDPGHPAADKDGYILTSNVNGLIESMDLKEAQRSFESNLNVIQMSRRMMAGVIDLLNS